MIRKNHKFFFVKIDEEKAFHVLCRMICLFLFSISRQAIPASFCCLCIPFLLRGFIAFQISLRLLLQGLQCHHLPTKIHSSYFFPAIQARLHRSAKLQISSLVPVPFRKESSPPGDRLCVWQLLPQQFAISSRALIRAVRCVIIMGVGRLPECSFGYCVVCSPV